MDILLELRTVYNAIPCKPLLLQRNCYLESDAWLLLSLVCWTCCYITIDNITDVYTGCQEQQYLAHSL